MLFQYASMHGVGNQAVIDRIVNAGTYNVVLAVDNDIPGTLRRFDNWKLQHLIPSVPYKDWNEMLVAGVQLPSEHASNYEFTQ